MRGSTTTYDPQGNQGFGGPVGDAEGSDRPPPPPYPCDPPGFGAPPGGDVPPTQYPPSGPPPGGYPAPGYQPPSGYGPSGFQPASGYGPPPGYGPPISYGGYPSGFGYGPPKTDGTAIVALVLAIASFVVCPIVPAIIALILIPNSRRTIENSGGAVGGTGLLTAAKIISWIDIGLASAGIALFVIGIIVAGTSTSTSPLIQPALVRSLVGA